MHKAEGLEENLNKCMESRDLESPEGIWKFQNTEHYYKSLLDSYEDTEMNISKVSEDWCTERKWIIKVGMRKRWKTQGEQLEN